MIYRFIIISNEVENFMREIKIDAHDTFLSLHKSIQQTCGYDDEEMTSFTICDDGWVKGQEVMLTDMGTSSEQDSYVMESTRLSELLIDEKQHLIYTYDMLAERVFFIELSQIIPKEHLDEPVVSRSQGEAPPQRIDFDSLMNRNPIVTGGGADYVDEDMLTSDDFDDEDLEIGGLDISDGEPF